MFNSIQYITGEMKRDNSIPTTYKIAFLKIEVSGFTHTSFILESSQTLFVVLRRVGSILGPPDFRWIQYSIVTIMYVQNSTCCIYIYRCFKKYYIYHFHRWESNFWHVPAKVIGCVTVYMTSSKKAWLGGEILMFIFSSLVFFEPDGSSLWWSRTRCLTLSAIPKLPESPVERIPPTVTQHLKRDAHVTECWYR